jgi:hypothetical protein
MRKPFTPFLTPDKPAPAGSSQAATADAPHADQAGAEPTITVKRDADRITHIIVHCTCGQVVELACEY